MFRRHRASSQPDPAVDLGAGDSARDRGDWDAAIHYYGRFLSAVTDRADIHVQLGHALREHNRLTDATASYRRALSINDTNVDGDAYLYLGHTLSLQGHQGEAVEAYLRALQNGDDRALPELWKSLIPTGFATHLIEQGKIDPNVLELTARIAARLPSMATVIQPPTEHFTPFAIAYDEGILTRTKFHIAYLVPSFDMSIVPNLLCSGDHDTQVGRIVRRMLRPDSVFVDIGANFGFFSVLAARAIGSAGNGRIIAIEPNETLARFLTKNLAINRVSQLATVEVVGAGAKASMARLYVPSASPGNGYISHFDSAFEESRGIDASNHSAIAIKRIDDIVPSDAQVDLIKIDTEGYEIEVFLGMAETLHRNPDIAIICEWNRATFNYGGKKPEVLIDIWRSHGFKLFDANTCKAMDYNDLLSVDFTDLFLGRDGDFLAYVLATLPI